jgi:hypothetical protein
MKTFIHRLYHKSWYLSSIFCFIFSFHLFIGKRTYILKRRVFPLTIVKYLKILENILSCFHSSFVFFTLNTFFLDCSKETLAFRALSRASTFLTHTDFYSMLFQEHLVPIAGMTLFPYQNGAACQLLDAAALMPLLPLL